MSGYGTRPTAGLLDTEDRRNALAQALLGIPSRIGNAFTGMAQRGLLANEQFMSGEGADQQFLPTMDSGGRLGALASFLSQNMAMGGPAGSLGAGPSMARRAAAVPQQQGIRGYHASPHDFDRFDMSKIGTGEGAQAYGHGVYIAESPAVSGRGGQYDKAFTSDLRLPVERALKKYNGDPDAALAAARNEIERLNALPNQGNNPERFASLMETQQRIVSGIDELKRTGELPKAKIYEVNIKADPNKFLDWDKPLGQQQAYQSIQKYAADAERLGVSDMYKDFIDASKMSGMTGADFMAVASNASQKNHAALSADLRAAGIPGIRYLDERSRGAGSGTSNYVVFDDKTIEILRKYGLAGLLAGGGAVLGGNASQAAPGLLQGEPQP